MAAVTLPLDLHPAVPAAAFAVALAGLLAAAAAPPGGTAGLGRLVRRSSRALIAVAVVAVVWDRHVFVSSAGIAPDDVLAALVVAGAVLLPRGARATAVLAGLALAAYLVAGAILVTATPYRSDAVVAAHGGAELLLQGQDPYARFDMVRELARFGLPATYATPLADGTRLRLLQYPALAVLMPAPFLAMGLGDVRVLYLAEVLVILGLVFASAPPPWRIVSLAIGIGDLAILDQFVLAGVDPLWALLALMAWLARRHRLAFAVLLGLAVSARQPAWLIAPFLVAWTWRALGGREALARAAVALGAALLIHLPFLLADAGAFVRGVTAPALLPLEAWGIGPAKLGADGLLPLLPRAVYLAAAVVTYLAALWAVASGRARGALTLPLLPLWVSYRALQSYFAFVAPFVLLDGAPPGEADIGKERLAAERAEPAAPGARGQRATGPARPGRDHRSL